MNRLTSDEIDILEDVAKEKFCLDEDSLTDKCIELGIDRHYLALVLLGKMTVEEAKADPFGYDKEWEEAVKLTESIEEDDMSYIDGALKECYKIADEIENR